MEKEDYMYIVEDIKKYINEIKNNICSGESEAIIEDIEEIIKSYEESEED